MKGFSLVELSIAMLIIGVLTVPLVTAHKIYKARQAHSTTVGNMNIVDDAIDKFIDDYGRYPVPASLAAVQGDTEFGVEGESMPALCTSGGWFATDGMCRTPPPNELLIGAVPFSTLRIPAGDSFDYWNDRILYVVTMSQTSAGSFVLGNGNSPYPGQVEVQSLDDAISSPPGVMTTIKNGMNIQYRDAVLISHGENGIGAYTASGVQVEPCRAPAAEYEDENCDLDNVFVLQGHPRGTAGGKRPPTRSYVDGGTYYDDYSLQMFFPSSTTWSPTPEVVTEKVVWTGGTRIGIGTTNPAAMLHVEGDVTATSRLRSDMICNQASGACFDPKVIGGAVTDMDCRKKLSLDSPVLGIGNEAVRCGTASILIDDKGTPTSSDDVYAPDSGEATYEFDSSYLQYKDCKETGQYLVNFDSSGAPICETYVP